MFFINLYRFLIGYVEIIVSGDYPERMLNLLAKNGIMPWNIAKNNSGIEMRLFNKSFMKLRKIRGKSGVKIKIKSKNGIGRYLKRFKLRYGLIAGFMLFLAIQKVMSLFIWQVEITGNSNTDRNKILSVCSELGIRNGVYIKNLDLPVIKQKMLLNLNNTAWGSINIEGCRATVNISEIKNGDIDNHPADIIADYDCVIKSIHVLKGIGVVTVGQAVQKGNLLISGATDYGESTQFLRASGEIVGEINETFCFEGTYKTMEKTYIGKEKTKNVLEIFSLKVPLYLGSTQGLYDTRISCKNVKFLGSPTPIYLHRKHFKKYVMYEKKLHDNELVDVLTKQYNSKMTELCARDIKILSQDIVRTDDSIKLIYNVKFTKKIGISVNLLF